jgi:hypothetical protein
MDTAARMVEFLGIACGETCEIVLLESIRKLSIPTLQ